MNRQAISIECGKIPDRAQQPGSMAAVAPLSVWALVPVKALAGAKQRLRDRMGPCREDFTRAMLTDVLAALAESQTLAGVAVVTSDQRVAAIAAKYGLTVVEELGCSGLNAAIDQGFEAVRGLGAGRVVILPSDIPLLTGAELDRLLEAFDRRAGKAVGEAIGISPSIDGGGTNCLMLGISQAFNFQYGPDSFASHCKSAKARQQDVFSFHSPAIALDIDEPRHVDELLLFCDRHPEYRKTATWKFLHDTTGGRGDTENALENGYE